MTNFKRSLYALAFVLLGFAGGWLAESRLRPHHRHEGLGLFGPGSHGPHAEGGDVPPPMEHMMDDLKVSTEQRATIRAIFVKRDANRTRRREAVEEARRDFEKSLASDVDQAALTPKFQRLADAKHDAELEHFQLMMDVRNALTTEQRAHLRELKGPPPGGPREP